jgi:uncharacterized protein (UPF0303 family)
MTADSEALIATLQEQQRELQFTHFDNEDAWALGCRFVEIARQRGLPIVVDIRRFGQQLFHAALPGTTPENDSWVERKIRVVNRFSEPSYLVGRRLAITGTALDQALGVDPIEFAAHGGAFPITIAGVGVVGTVTVSGLPQADDHALVVDILRQFIAEAAHRV